MEGLFHSCPALKKVYIGRTLDYDASEQYGPFHGLTNLEEVTIGEEVEELDEKLFAGCTGLKTVYYNAYSAGFTPSYRYRSPFGEGSAVEQVIVGESVRYIPRGFCKNNTSLRSVTIRPHDFPSLRQFVTEAFSGCTQLEEVHIEDLAGWCSATFASESANPLSPGADLYVNGELVRTLQIPDSTYIQSYAFAGCTSVEEIHIPASVRSVYSGAFAECTSLRKLVVEGDLTIMGTDFLSGCTALEELYFMGAPSSYNFMTHVPADAAVYALPSEARRIENEWNGRVIEFGPEVSLKKRYLAAIVFSVANHCPEGMDVRIDKVTFDGAAAEPTEGDSLYRIDGLEPETWHEVVVYYTAYGKEYTYSTELKTEYLSVSLYGAETGQCHIAFDAVLASSDETMQPGRKGVVFNSTNYPIEEDGIRFDNLVPGRQYTFTPYAVYDGKTYYGGEYKYATKSVSPRISILQTGGQFAVMSDYVGATGHGETTFPEVNTRLLSAEIPLKAGWDFRLGRNVVLSPHIGAYARYALASIKDNVRTANEEQTEKWNCLKNYNKGHRHIEAFKRFDAGLTAEVELRLFRHYLLTAGYRRGFVEQSAQYGLKSQIFTVALGYLF